MKRASARAWGVLLVASWLRLAAAAPDAPRQPGAQPPPQPDAGPERADGGTAPDPDAEVISHLEELEQLELLQHLGLLDPAGEDDQPAAPSDGGSRR
jgi:hypothetical protein